MCACALFGGGEEVINFTLDVLQNYSKPLVDIVGYTYIHNVLAGRCTVL